MLTVNYLSSGEGKAGINYTVGAVCDKVESGADEYGCPRFQHACLRGQFCDAERQSKVHRCNTAL